MVLLKKRKINILFLPKKLIFHAVFLSVKQTFILFINLVSDVLVSIFDVEIIIDFIHEILNQYFGTHTHTLNHNRQRPSTGRCRVVGFCSIYFSSRYLPNIIGAIWIWFR